MEIRTATTGDLESICLLNEEFWLYNAGLQPNYYKATKDTGDYARNVILNDTSDILLAV